ncbi:MAG: hypothetical protein ABIQ33_03250 [Caldimonas sp.]
MNDAERDAWLREALRHAPDSDALPPSGVSEAILAKAHAAARAAATPAARRSATHATPANPLAAFWNWLARPPVAAGFASVMAATLVGLMWWDRPIDETMPRAPALAREQEKVVRPRVAPAPPATTPAAAPPAAMPLQAGPPEAPAPPPAPDPRRAADAKLAEPRPEPARRSVESLAQEPVPKEARKNEAPVPFPPLDARPERSAERKSPLGAATDAAKKDTDADRPRAPDALHRAPESAVAQPVAPPPLASGRLRADGRRIPAPAESSDAVTAKSGLGAPAPAPATLAAPARDNTPAVPLDERVQRQRAITAPREKEAAAFGSSTPARNADSVTPFRPQLDRGRSETAAAARAGAATPAGAAMTAAPPARILAAIAAEPERWSRQTAAGDTVVLDGAWRAWLADLDGAAVGRWRPLAVGVATGVAAGEGTTTLRLVAAGRVAAIVRIDGANVELDASPGTVSDRWQAVLDPATAERLRSSGRRLAP